MLRNRLLIIFLLLSATVRGQTWLQTGNTLQRSIATDTNYRFNLGSPGYMYFYTKPQIDAKYQPKLTLTTVGTGGSATLIGNVLNIPNYSSGSSGVTSFNTRTGAVTLLSADVTTALGFTPENIANKTATSSSSITTYPNWLGITNYAQTLANLETTVTNSSTLYPSGSAVTSYVSGKADTANVVLRIGRNNAQVVPGGTLPGGTLNLLSSLGRTPTAYGTIQFGNLARTGNGGAITMTDTLAGPYTSGQPINYLAITPYMAQQSANNLQVRGIELFPTLYLGGFANTATTGYSGIYIRPSVVGGGSQLVVNGAFSRLDASAAAAIGTYNAFAIEAPGLSTGATITTTVGFNASGIISGTNNAVLYQSSSGSGMSVTDLTGNWFLYGQNSGFNNYLAGNVWVGANSGTNKFEVTSTSPQMRLNYTSGSVYGIQNIDVNGAYNNTPTGGKWYWEPTTGASTPIATSVNEVQAATGTATVTPLINRLRSLTDGSSFAVGTPYIGYYMYSNDASGTASDRGAVVMQHRLNDGSADDMGFYVKSAGTFGEQWRISSSITGALTNRVTTPVAFLDLKGGTTANAPLGLQSGPLLTTPIVGSEEFLTDKRYTTITTGTARKEYALWDAAGTSGRVPYETTNGRLIDASTFTFDGTSLTAAMSSTSTGVTQTTGDVSLKLATDQFVNSTVAALGAAPTALVGTTAITGTAATFIHSDGAPAINQAMVPTWTGNHTWAQAVGGGNTSTFTSTMFISNPTASVNTGSSQQNSPFLEWRGSAFGTTVSDPVAFRVGMQPQYTGATPSGITFFQYNLNNGGFQTVAELTSASGFYTGTDGTTGQIGSAQANFGQGQASLGATNYTSLILPNQAAATASITTQWSPQFEQQSQGWQTSGTPQSIQMFYYQGLKAVSGAAVSARESFNFQNTNGGSIVEAMSLNSSGQLALPSAQTVVNGSTSGTATYSQPFNGSSYKKVIIYLNALSGTATYAIPTAFTNTPVVVSTNGLATTVVTSLSTTSITCTSSGSSGVLLIEGY